MFGVHHTMVDSKTRRVIARLGLEGDDHAGRKQTALISVQLVELVLAIASVVFPRGVGVGGQPQQSIHARWWRGMDRLCSNAIQTGESKCSAW
jgi:hypothetical protein